MIGEIVNHVRFGRGRVTAFAPPRIEITFEGDVVRAFAYPQAVERFLRFEREDARQRALRDRDQADTDARERDMLRILQDRQRAEEAARKSLDALHEKKVAAARRAAARSAAARKEKEEKG